MAIDVSSIFYSSLNSSNTLMTEESFQQEIELYTTSVSFDVKEKQTNEARPSKKIPI